MMHRMPHRSRGFTLVEVLIALTIFLIVGAAIAGVFVSSIQTVRQGHKNRELLESARATMTLVERDIQRSFTARDRGDYYHFYGTPYGFTFVGNVLATNAGDQPNLGRVSYVLYTNYNPNADPNVELPSGTNVFDVTLPDDTSQRHVTYSLLRYAEPHIDDLDSYVAPLMQGSNRFNWRTLAAAGEAGSPNAVLLNELNNACSCDFLDPTSVENVRRTRPDDYQYLQGKQRELYLRMLGGDPVLPNIWAYWDAIAGGDDGLVPADFLLADDIRLSKIPAEILNDPVAFFGDSNFESLRLDPYVFGLDSGYAAGVTVVTILGVDVPFEFSPINDFRQLSEEARLLWTIATLAQGDGDRLTELGNLAAAEPRYILASRARDLLGGSRLFQYGQVAMERFGAGATSRAPMSLYWNDRRNQELDIGVARGYWAEELGPLGTPLAPRIPALVDLSFSYLVPSPYVGAAEFRRSFQKVIEVPAGFVRAS